MSDDNRSVPEGQTDIDDWFNDDLYERAAGIAYKYSKQKAEDAGEQERQTIGKGAEEQRKSSRQSQEFSERDEARDYSQAQKARRF